MLGDDLYRKYSIYLQQKVEKKRLTNNKYRLLLISYNFFLNFTSLYHSSESLRKRIDGIYQEEVREEKLNQILK